MKNSRNKPALPEIGKDLFIILVTSLKLHLKKLFLLVFTVKFLEVYAKKEKRRNFF
jgi:hypothetical protein